MSKVVSNFFKKAGDFYMKHMSRSGHMKEYLPKGDEPAKSFRFPSPGSQPAAPTPTGLKEHKFKTSYYDRETISTGRPMKPNVPMLSAADAKLLPMAEEGVSDDLKVMPFHLDKPGWWVKQEAYTEQCDEIGAYTPGMSDWAYFRKVGKHYPENF
ncbi:hypothetical protein AAMO2058_000372600 [Amorphochlora amoebiformis]|mmetsp:Transcript_32298/g.52041  ORF Transcript_32298/g.52041 Transcript_32298/m.52041 type:complete len:155 (-) Transcript_32298:152-616(-)